jgi:hypothetical protein
VLATRLTLKLARGMFFVSAGFGVLLGGGIILVAATAGVCAAAVVTLYGAAHLFADLFGFSFRWGLVTSCGLLFLGCALGGMIHDFRLKTMPPQPAERQTTRERHSIPLSSVPTPLDNGRRSPRKLLRAVVARLLGRKP